MELVNVFIFYSLYFWGFSLLFRHIPSLPPTLHHPKSPSKLLPAVLSSIFSLHWIRINDVPNKNRWKTSKQFPLSAIVRRSPAKTVRTRVRNLSLPLIFCTALSHPSYSYHSIRSYSLTVHLKYCHPTPTIQ